MAECERGAAAPFHAHPSCTAVRPCREGRCRMKRARVVIAAWLTLSSVAGCRRAGFKDTFAQGFDAAPTVVSSSSPPLSSPPHSTGTPDVAALVARVNSSVVNITTVHDVKQQGLDFDPFDFF